MPKPERIAAMRAQFAAGRTPGACSRLVAARLPLAASFFALPALRPDMWCRLAVRHARRLAEVPLCLASLDGPAEQHGALTEGGAERQLVKGQALAAGLDDARA